jgi:AraC-like DNA-binding protein
MTQNIDFLVRMIAIGAGLMLIAQIVAGQVRDKIKLPLIGVIVGVIAYLVMSNPMSRVTGPLAPWISIIALASPLSIWLFARNLFEREPEQRIVLAALAAMLFGWFIGHFVPWTGTIGFYLVHIVGLALIIDLVRVGVFERDDDLVEQRRVIRLWLPLLVAAQAASVLTFELFEISTGEFGRFEIVHLINSLLILTITLFAGLALLRTDPELLLVTEEDGTLDTDERARDLSPSETVLHEKLNAAMAEGAYREPGLTITELAEQLDTPEHRLRALINRRLGHRNFSSFLNRHRIAEAKAQLADRAMVDVPVLTIAMDLGYNSLPPFNRAFRAETGTTPSEFRRDAIGEDATAATEQN